MGATRSWTDEALAEAVRQETTIASVARALGLKPSGGTHSHLLRHIRRLGLDTSHMRGRSWRKGLPPVRRRIRPLSEILVADSDYLSSGKLRERLIAAGLKPRWCERCGIHDWLGRRIPLELDHINGDRSDNRIENLRILCPNCHSQTETWCRMKPRPV